MGRLRADSGEKHEPVCGDFKPGRKTVFGSRGLPTRQTGALTAAESGPRVLNQAAIEKPTGNLQNGEASPQAHTVCVALPFWFITVNLDRGKGIQQ